MCIRSEMVCIRDCCPILTKPVSPKLIQPDNPGILRLELSKDIFERTGLTGRSVRSGGRKHAKERYRG